MSYEEDFTLRAKADDELDDFDDQEELDDEFEEEENEQDEEVDFDNPSFSRDQIWNDYAEDLDFDD